MFSIRKTTVLVAAASLMVLAGGCTKIADSQPNVSAEPQVVDAAMEKRDWPQSVAYIPSGATVAGDTGFAYEPTRGRKQYNYYYADAGVFALNVVTLPYTFWKNGIAQPQTFPGERTNPTYTGVPALPAGNTTVSPDPTPAEPMERPANEAAGTVEQGAPTPTDPQAK